MHCKQIIKHTNAVPFLVGKLQVNNFLPFCAVLLFSSHLINKCVDILVSAVEMHYKLQYVNTYCTHLDSAHEVITYVEDQQTAMSRRSWRITFSPHTFGCLQTFAFTWQRSVPVNC